MRLIIPPAQLLRILLGGPQPDNLLLELVDFGIGLTFEFADGALTVALLLVDGGSCFGSLLFRFGEIIIREARLPPVECKTRY